MTSAEGSVFNASANLRSLSFLKDCFVSGLIILVLGLTTSTQSFAAERLPIHKFDIVCAPSLENYVSELRSIASFARQYEAQPVYVSIQIAATARSGFCSMFREGKSPESSKLPDDHGIRLPYVKSTPGTLVVWARTLEETAGTTSFQLPPLNDLPADGLYEARTRSTDFFYYEGPAVLRHSTTNGNEHVEFHPIRNSHVYWKEVQRIRDHGIDAK